MDLPKGYNPRGDESSISAGALESRLRRFRSGQGKSAAAASPVDSALKGAFKDKDTRSAAKGFGDLYNSIITPEYQQGNMFNPSLGGGAGSLEQQNLDTQRGAITTAGQRSPDAQQAIDLLRGQATQSEYNSPELLQAFQAAQALATGGQSPIAAAQREQLNAGLNSNLQTALRLAANQGLMRGVTGGAQSSLARPAIADFAQQQGQGQVGLQLGNLQRYTDLAGLLDQNRFDRHYAALNSFNQGLGQRETFEANNVQQKQDAYSNSLNNSVNRYNSLLQHDMDQRDSYKAGLFGAYTGGGAFGEARQGRIEGNKLAAKSIEAASQPIPSFGNSSENQPVDQFQTPNSGAA